MKPEIPMEMFKGRPVSLISEKWVFFWFFVFILADLYLAWIIFDEEIQNFLRWVG